MGKHKLTDEQAAEIRKQYQNGRRPKFIAKEFSVSTHTVRMIASGKTHKLPNP